MSEPIETVEGWWAYHDFRCISWPLWQQASVQEKELAIAEAMAFAEGFAGLQEAHAGAFGMYQIAGHKADLLWLHLRPTLDELLRLKAQTGRLRLERYLTPAYSYTSVVELSAYLAKGHTDPQASEHLRSRLEPNLPDANYVAFYPMTKRRDGEDNWYMLDRAARADLMKGHGSVGHSHRHHVVQIITGSQGLDDWEWGVTLFSDDPVAFKKIVYEMRFDEATARFAEFGPFFVGRRGGAEDLASWLGHEARRGPVSSGL